MFKKPFELKSNSTVKGSDRKKIRAHLEKNYSAIPSEVMSELVPTKGGDMSQLKILTDGGQSVIVYMLGANPYFFDIQNQLFPTVYLLWKFPDLLPCYTTWPPVFSKLLGGADLMQPGVVLRGHCTKLETLKMNDIVSVKLVGNKAPIAVGRSAINADKIFSEDRKGKAVIVAHIFGDHLWKLGTQCEPPLIADDLTGSKDSDVDSDVDSKDAEELVTGVSAVPASEETEEKIEETLESLTITSKEDECSSPKTETELMDELLTNCFLTTMKTRMKKVELPLLTSTFYSAHMLACCPSSRTLDIRKSSYKKFSQFLKAMQSDGLLELKELSKGVESIVAVNLEHARVRRFKPETKSEEAVEENDTQAPYSPPKIEELFVVSAAVLPFFKTRKIGKGATFLSGEVRKLLTDYIMEENLKSPENPRQVVLNPILADTLLNKGEYLEKLLWEEVVSRCLAKMSPAHQITFSNRDPIVRKGQIHPIDINVAQRTGNKKVTLIYNLEQYGIEPEKFAHQVQLGVAASTSVGPAQSGKGIQVLVQGNQVIFVSKLLLGEYQLPRKYITGLDNVPTKKKK